MGKRYLIGHQNKERFPTFRDVMVRGTRNIGRRLLHPLKASAGNTLVGCREVEEFWALKNVSFEVKQGERIGIIGRNGAGKSTLLKILSRITEPTTGRVSLKGRVASLLEVGTGFHPELTGRENIFLNGAILGMSRAEINKKFDEIVDFAEIEKFLDTPVKRYSSGMYVRLAFAVAAHLDPEILIVDEVLAVGDVQFQKKCLGKMEEVAAQCGRTVIFVSHNMAAVQSLCNAAILLEDGVIKQQGPASAIVDGYLKLALKDITDELNLENVPRSGHYGDALKLSKIRFNGVAGIRHGQPLDVELEFICNADVESVSFGIGFCSSGGTRIMTIDSDAGGKTYNFKKGHLGIAHFHLKNFLLAPDLYLIDVGSRSGNDHALDYLEQVGTVLVSPSKSTPSSIMMRNSLTGGYRPNVPWTFYS